MVGSQVSWSYATVVDSMNNPTFTDWSGITAMGTGAGVALTPEQADTLAERLLQLDGIDDAGELLPLLSGCSEQHPLVC